MSEYRYYVAEVRTRTAVLELPLYGVYMDKVRNGAGNFTGTFRLGTNIFVDSDLITFTRPGRYAIVCKRDDVIIWAGPIWSRTYSGDAKTVQLTAQTYESIFSKIPFLANFVKTSIEQTTIIANAITAMQSTTEHQFNMTTLGTGASGFTRTVSYSAASLTPIQELLDLISKFDDGVNYTINVMTTTPGDTINLYLQLLWGAPGTAGMYYDYPGTVAQYWYTENASRAGIVNVAKTNDPTYGDVASSVTDTALVTAGYPKWYHYESYSDVANITQLNALAARQALQFKMPIANPIFELGPDALFDGWNKIGLTVTVNVQDPRFPDSQIFAKELIGWSLTPGSSSSVEVIRLQLQGEDL